MLPPRALVLLVCLALAGPAAATQFEAPDALVSRVSGEVLQILQQSKGSAGSNAEMALVRAKILPHFDFERMTALATGIGWRSASEAQQAALVEQFRQLLVRTYSSSLSRFDNQTLEFQPLRAAKDPDRVIVRSLLKQPGAQAISVDYRMANGSDGWKIYDVVVDGVSLVTTYRDSFAQEVQSSGIEGLIRMLRDKNAQLAAGGD